MADVVVTVRSEGIEETTQQMRDLASAASDASVAVAQVPCKPTHHSYDVVGMSMGGPIVAVCRRCGDTFDVIERARSKAR